MMKSAEARLHAAGMFQVTRDAQEGFLAGPSVATNGVAL
jgi:hypothetical protein